MSNQEFCEGLVQAMKDERGASELYLKTARCAPRRSISDIILGIRADERRHRAEFVRMYNKYCPKASPMEPTSKL